MKKFLAIICAIFLVNCSYDEKDVLNFVQNLVCVKYKDACFCVTESRNAFKGFAPMQFCEDETKECK